ncbi:MAG: arginine repressor [Planctomycetota bacterium]|nr:MAG: arginine repressor [Planctomycetota bacterium]
MNEAQPLRRQFLREILRKGEAGTQAELQQALAARGLDATQPSISRDLRSLGAIKVGGRYHLHEADRITPLENLRTLLRGVDSAGPHLTLIFCEPGAASAIARALEGEHFPGLAGTVAGDDTVFAAMKTQSAGRDLQRRIAALLA